MNVMEWIRPSRTVEAHCDLPCGIYDPEQARIEAESVYNIIKKYNDSKDEVYRQRAIIIKEERAELANSGRSSSKRSGPSWPSITSTFSGATGTSPRSTTPSSPNSRMR